MDRPVWEWCRFNPVSTIAGSAMCTSDDGTGRYIYYLTTTTFWRYDIWTDGWQALAAPLNAAGTSAALKYSMYGGYRGHVISAPANNKLKIAGLKNGILLEKTDNSAITIRIMTGTGAGQEKTVTAIDQLVIEDFGVASSGSTATVVDNLRGTTMPLWKINQWRGYQVRITYGAGLSQVRKIMYNDGTTLYVSSNNHQPIEPFNNALFTVTPAANSMYQIESSTITVNSNWSPNPDNTSTYAFMSGGVWYVSTAATPGWCVMNYYDIHSDTWLPKTVMMNAQGVALATDWCIERTGEVGGQFYGPVAATNGGSNTARSFTDTAASGWAVDQWTGYQLRITSGTAMGQRRRIVGNSTTVIYVQRAFDVTPGLTDTYQIMGDTDKIYLSGSGRASMLQYSIENDIWAPGAQWDWGVTRIGSAQLKLPASAMGTQEAIGLTSITYVVAGINAAPTINAGGTGFTRASVGTLSTGMTNVTGAQIRITGVSSAGAVTSIELVHAGNTGTTGTSAVTTAIGSGLILNIVVGKVGLVTSVINHNFGISDPLLLAGDTSAGTYWNGNFTVLCVSSLTVFHVTGNASSSINALYTAQTASLIIDSTQNWATNEHQGKCVMIMHTPTNPGIYTASAAAMVRIASNDATSLTLATALTSAGGNGISRYVIYSPEAFGREEQYKITTKNGTGYASGTGTSTTLIDSTKNWELNQWAAYKVRIISGAGLGTESTISANTNNTLTMGATQGAVNTDVTTKYIIMDTFGICTSAGTTTAINDTTKNWQVNCLAGKYIKIMTGVNQGLEYSITSNTATQIVPATLGVASAVDMIYSVVSRPLTATNLTLQWAYSPSRLQKGRYFIAARGNSPYFDIYDIVTNTWDMQTLYTPQTENLVLGSMYAYDGADKLYFTVGATGRVQYLDLGTGMVQGSSITPYAHGIGLAGNRMELVTTADGLDYLYIMRHTGAEFWRTLAFWSGW